MASKVPFVKFNNGETFPTFGLGTWKVSFLCFDIFVHTYFYLRFFKSAVRNMISDI